MTEPESPVDGSEHAVDGTDTSIEGADTTEQPESFPLAYVQRLREENRAARLKVQRTQQLAERLTHAMAETTGRLIDPSDLQFSDDLLDENGMPDKDKVLSSIEDLLARKPHLARINVRGDVGQGNHSVSEPTTSLAQMLRQGAG
jgi:hypothetical protein